MFSKSLYLDTGPYENEKQLFQVRDFYIPFCNIIFIVFKYLLGLRKYIFAGKKSSDIFSKYRQPNFEFFNYSYLNMILVLIKNNILMVLVETNQNGCIPSPMIKSPTTTNHDVQMSP